mmetsp:Transcript_15964/g.33722  ORF Transcript_15964/g.33722 Transcript_15964/m.33722 type:complete len:575 (-) Transcript_15964:250-1974(-)
MVFKSKRKNVDLVMAMRGVVATDIDTTKDQHKLQSPRAGPDPVLQARSLEQKGSLGPIGVNQIAGTNPKPLSASPIPTNTKKEPKRNAGILKEGRLTPQPPPSGQFSQPPPPGRFFPEGGKGDNDDSSLESIGYFDGFTEDAIPDDDTTTVGVNTLSSEAQRRVRWEPGVKSGSRRSGCNYTMSINGLIDNFSQIMMKNVTKLDGSARRLGRGLEGLGMKCASGGSGNMCDALGEVGPTLPTSPKCYKCGINDGLDGGLFSFESVSMSSKLSKRKKEGSMSSGSRGEGANQDKVDGDKENNNGDNDEKRLMCQAMLETNEAESREYFDDSRKVANELREAAEAMSKATERQLSQQQSKMRGGIEFIALKKGPESQRASVNNTELSIDNGLYTSPDEDPFSASMHANQLSPRSILKKKRSFGGGIQGDLQLASPSPKPLTSTRGTTILSPISSLSAASNNVNNRRHHTSSSSKHHGRRNKDKRHNHTTFTTKTASTSGKGKKSSSRNKPDATAVPSEAPKKKKKNISRLVMGGLKKPMKFVAKGVKSSMRNHPRRPKTILALTATSDRDRNGGGY